MTKVTVAIPAYNAADYLDRAIRSVLTQACRALEVIVVDDASTDGTFSVARRHTCDPRVRIYRHLANRGMSAALNSALRIAQAPIVVHLDADDWLEPTALTSVVRRMQAPDRPAAVYARGIFHGQGAHPRPAELFVPKTPVEYLTDDRPPQVPRAYSVPIMRRLGGWRTHDAFGGRYYEDRSTLWRVASRYKVPAIDEPLYNITMRSDSLSRAEPQIVALAKYGVLCDIATETGVNISAVYECGFLKASHESLSNTPRASWSIVVAHDICHTSSRRSLLSWAESDAAERVAEVVYVDRSEAGDGASLENRLPVTYVRAPGASVVEAFNIGSEYARHKYVIFASGLDIVPRRVLGFHEHYHRLGRCLVSARFLGRLTASALHAEPGIELRRRISEIEDCWSGSRVDSVGSGRDGISGCSATSREKDQWAHARSKGFVGDGSKVDPEVANAWRASFQHAAPTLLSCDSLSIRREDFTALGGLDPRLGHRSAAQHFADRFREDGGRVLICPAAEPFFQLAAPAQYCREYAIPNTSWLAHDRDLSVNDEMTA